MCQLIESIKLKDGKFYHLDLHQKRMDASISSLFSSQNTVQLHRVLSGLKIPKNGLFKCRIVYDQSMYDIQLDPYRQKKIKKLRIVKGDHINYEFKYKNRAQLNDLLNENKDVDEVIILKKGLITDSSYSNLVFWNNEGWITPAKPLLRGIQREVLLLSKNIQEAEIRVNDLKNFKKIGFINAMMPMEDMPVVSVENIEY